MMPKSHLSASQINMFLRCPMQYKFRYVDGIILPPTTALTKGKTVHEGVEYNYTQKKDTKKDLPVEEVKEYTAHKFEEMKDETDWGKNDPNTVKDKSINLVELYHTEIAPAIIPQAVEERVEITFDNTNYSLLGYIDVIDQHSFIRDTKTTGRTPKQNDLKTNLQLTVYSLAYRTMTGEQEGGVALDYLVDTKQPKIAQFEEHRTDEDIRKFQKLMGIVAHNIECENYYPNPTNFMCSPSNCGYWELCEKEW